MLFLVAAVIVSTVLCLGNLLLTFAILRRLRDHEERLAGGGPFGSPGPDALIGRTMPAFTGTSTRGEAVSEATGRLVGFFSASCGPCRELAAEFARHPDEGRMAFVVLESASEPDRAAILDALGDSPTVLVDPTSQAVAEALGVRSFPTLVQVDEADTVVEARHSLAALAG
ncbi:TlpA family protein disulfide reductase [Pseudonocardia acaciae]|uniref:TlpA family protein disulfide reductase n=1 Tax=Pseudonocardia acaciae TaxID=551276 RepID=UPI00048CE7F4|nr:hypothetical protein [Pseudonocardia acaciae]